jgi:hypothetical protein
MDPQQLAMILQSLPPEQRMQMQAALGGMAPQPTALPAQGGGLAAILASLGGGGQGMGQMRDTPGVMTNRHGQPLSANAAGFVGAGQAANAPDAWKMTPAQALTGALGGYSQGKRQQTAGLQQQQQGQSGLMNILKMLQGQQSYGTGGYAQTPVLGPGGRMGGGV